MVGFYLIVFLLYPLSVTVVVQAEALQLLHFHEQNPVLRSSTAVSVTVADLPAVSSSVLAAEAWLRSHVLAHFPSTRISTIVVGSDIPCNDQLWNSVLPSAKNLHYSLVRWGLVEEIKVAASFPAADCSHMGGIDQIVLKPLLRFLQDNSSVYVIDDDDDEDENPSSHSISEHRAALKRLGFSGLRVARAVREAKPMSRRGLSFLKFAAFRDLPTAPSRYPHPPPLLEFAPVPDGSFSFAPDASPVIPANPPDKFAAPPPLDFAPVPDGSFSFAPDASPVIPANPPDTIAAPAPTCIAAPGKSPAPGPGGEPTKKGGMWCVAKPTVPAEKLQEAMDYACGEGGADCEEIKPNGSCYYPDNVVGHASYAFNSYWQKTKEVGGSCSFDGTALLVTSDPSFLQCHFILI